MLPDTDTAPASHGSMILQRGISDIREENRRLMDTERRQHKEEVQKIETKLRSERDAFEVR